MSLHYNSNNVMARMCGDRTTSPIFDLLNKDGCSTGMEQVLNNEYVLIHTMHLTMHQYSIKTNLVPRLRLCIWV